MNNDDYPKITNYGAHFTDAGLCCDNCGNVNNFKVVGLCDAICGNGKVLECIRCGNRATQMYWICNPERYAAD